MYVAKLDDSNVVEQVFVMNRNKIMDNSVGKPTQAKAQSFSIVAVVNGEAVSNFALHDRINLVILSSGMANTTGPSARRHLAHWQPCPRPWPADHQQDSMC